jgi:hypothetical protein
MAVNLMIKKSNVTYFTMPENDVTVTAIFRIEDWFEVISTDMYFRLPIKKNDRPSP